MTNTSNIRRLGHLQEAAHLGIHALSALNSRTPFHAALQITCQWRHKAGWGGAGGGANSWPVHMNRVSLGFGMSPLCDLQGLHHPVIHAP